MSFSIPYLIYDEYAGLNSKVGFIFGSLAVMSFVFTYWVVPECKGKTLEQIDILFGNGTRLRDFGNTGLDSTVEVEAASVSEKKGQD